MFHNYYKTTKISLNNTKQQTTITARTTTTRSSTLQVLLLDPTVLLQVLHDAVQIRLLRDRVLERVRELANVPATREVLAALDRPRRDRARDHTTCVPDGALVVPSSTGKRPRF